MTTDQHGLAVSGAGRAAVRHYDRAVDALLHFRPEVEAETAAALAEAPGFPMANVLSAYLGLLTTEPAPAREARERFAAFLRRADPTAWSPRERAHAEAAGALLGGDLTRCGALLARITERHPRDALALAAGHQVDFFTGDARSLRDRIGGALSAWHDDDPHYGHLLGMYAFGLEEAYHYDRSEEVGLRAVELNRRDVWGIHTVAHTYEMQGRFGDGIRFLDERVGDWSTGTFFNVHTWWHYTLYALERGETGRVLDIYDAVLAERRDRDAVAGRLGPAVAPLPGGRRAGRAVGGAGGRVAGQDGRGLSRVQRHARGHGVRGSGPRRRGGAAHRGAGGVRARAASRGHQPGDDRAGGAAGVPGAGGLRAGATMTGSSSCSSRSGTG
ncbi:hypothetical protein ACFSTC_31435 [Nonomuraea ferruginea]